MEKLFSKAADIFSEQLTKEGENCFIVPGGSTPSLFYKYLAEKVLDWRGVTLIPSDERLVHETSSQSNVGMIRKGLIERIQNKDKPTLLSFIDNNKKQDLLSSFSSLKFKVSLLMPSKAAFLGIGEDGHTASLFPGHEETWFSNEPLVLIKRDTEPFQRISLSASLLSSVPRLIFLVSGDRKRPIMQKLLDNKGKTDALPIMQLKKRAKGKVTIFCDKTAYPND